jgi:hypothetical protein
MTRLLLICSIAGTLWAAPTIAHSDIDVRTNDGRLYSVRMKIATAGEAWSAPSHTLEGHVMDFRATLDGVSLEPRIKPSGAVDRVVFPRPLPKGATYELTYSIEADPGVTVRIPLAVPEIPVSGGARSIQIRAAPPLSGDTFPAFQQNVAELANFPNHIEIDQQSRLWTPTHLSDLGVLLLLAAGTIGRILLRKRGSPA